MSRYHRGGVVVSNPAQFAGSVVMVPSQFAGGPSIAGFNIHSKYGRRSLEAEEQLTSHELGAKHNPWSQFTSEVWANSKIPGHQNYGAWNSYRDVLQDPGVKDAYYASGYKEIFNEANKDRIQAYDNLVLPPGVHRYPKKVKKSVKQQNKPKKAKKVKPAEVQMVPMMIAPAPAATVAAGRGYRTRY